jgi:hypothetical protein
MATMIRYGVLRAGEALRVLLALLTIASFSAEVWAQAGYVHELSGSVTSQAGTAPPAPIRAGDTFDAGAVFASGADGRVTLKFSDGQVLAVAPNSMVGIQQYHFDPRNVKASSVAIAIQGGAIRFVSGVIASENREAVRISAGESLFTIQRAGGIDFTLAVDAKGQEVGAATVAVGEIAARTANGPIVRIEAGQAVLLRPGAPPSSPIPIAAAPASIQAELAGLRSVALPSSAPVAVVPAARAVVAVTSARQAETAAAASPSNAQLQVSAQAAAELAATAAKASTAAAADLLAQVQSLESRLAALPATAAIAVPLAGSARTDIPSLPIVPIPPVIPPGRCIGSPC